MTYTIGTASSATGKSKSTISRAIKSGRISAVKNEKGEYSIEPSELHRIFPYAQNTAIVKRTDSVKSRRSGTPQNNKVSEERIRLLERERNQLLETIEDLRNRLDNESEERRKIHAMLTNQQTRPSFWKKLLPV